MEAHTAGVQGGIRNTTQSLEVAQRDEKGSFKSGQVLPKGNWIEMEASVQDVEKVVFIYFVGQTGSITGQPLVSNLLTMLCIFTRPQSLTK